MKTCEGGGLAGNSRFLTVKTLIWAQLIILTLMAASGAVYFAATITGSGELSSLVFPVALFLANVLRILFYGFLGFTIVLGIYRRLTRPKTPLEPGLIEKLGRVVTETKARMGSQKPIQALILRKSSNAFYRGKNRIVVGEMLVRKMDDEELMGVLGHEIAHGTKRHILIKTAMIPLVLVLIFAFSLFAPFSQAGGVLLWTLAAWFAFCQIPLSWSLEYAADAEAAEHLGGDKMAASLQKLGTMNFGGISFTHPPMASRIMRVGRFGPVQFVSSPVIVPEIGSIPPPDKIESSNPLPLPEKIKDTLDKPEKSKLETGEVTVWHGRPAYHLRYLILTIIFFAGIFTIDLGPVGQIVGALSALLWIAFGVVTIIAFIIDRRTSYYVTNQRVIVGRTTLLTQDLVSVRVEKTFLGGLRGTGKIYLNFKDGRWTSFKRVKEAAQVRQSILSLRATLPDAPTNTSMICNYCGSRVPLGALKCPQCGADM